MNIHLETYIACYPHVQMRLVVAMVVTTMVREEDQCRLYVEGRVREKVHVFQSLHRRLTSRRTSSSRMMNSNATVRIVLAQRRARFKKTIQREQSRQR